MASSPYFRSTMRRFLASTALGLVLICAETVTDAAAQNATPTATPQTPAQPQMQLPILSVEGGGNSSYQTDAPTLPKLTQPLLDTPQTIDAVPRQVMEDQGVSTMRDALRNVPGISLGAGEYSSQGDNLTIRGFSARSDIYLDGMRDFGSYYRDPFFLDDIQVLQGPSSILFGRGSTGGVVEQDSKTPQLVPFTTGTLGFGTDMTRRATVDFNRPLPDWGQGAALRINLMANDNGVAGRNNAEYSRIGIAPSLALGLGTPTRLTFSYLHQTEYDMPDYGLPWLYQGVSGQGSGLARPADVSRDNFYGFSDNDYLRTNVDIPTVKFEHDFSDALSFRDQLRYAHYVRQFRITEPQLYIPGTKVSELVAPGTPLDSLLVSRNELYGTSLETSLENQSDMTARFNTGFIAHTLVAGIELGRETSDPVRFTTTTPYSLTSLVNPDPGDTYNASTYLASRTNTTALTQAIYALDTLKFNEQWQLMGGLRLDRFDANFNQTSFAQGTGAQTGSTAFHHVDIMPSWRGAIVYKPLPNGSIYFDAGTSFDPSAEALSLSAATAPLAPEKNTTFELGTKWNLLHERLSLTAAIFKTQQDNLREPSPTDPSIDILAGNAESKGFTLGVTGHLTEHWQVLVGYAYTFSEVDESPVSGPGSDLGHRLANVPMHTANLWTTYTLPWKLEIGAGIDYVSARYASTTPTLACPATNSSCTASTGGVEFWKEVPGYYTLSAMAKYPLTDHIGLQLNLYNLTDNFYFDQIHPSHIVPGAGRSALLTLNVKY